MYTILSYDKNNCLAHMKPPVNCVLIITGTHVLLLPVAQTNIITHHIFTCIATEPSVLYADVYLLTINGF